MFIRCFKLKGNIDAKASLTQEAKFIYLTLSYLETKHFTNSFNLIIFIF